MSDLILRRLRTALPRLAFRFANEAELHEGLAQALAQEGIAFQREFVAGPKDRFDFLCESGIVLEAKIHGAMAPALRQCVRYLERDDVNAVLLVTTRHWGRVTPRELKHRANSKPIVVVQLKGQSF